VGSGSDSQALALQDIKDQEASKLTLARFLEQCPGLKDGTGGEVVVQDLGSEAGSNFSDDEQPLLSNLEKVTEFLVSSAAFKTFKDALCAFVRPARGPTTAATQHESQMSLGSDASTQINADVIDAPKSDPGMSVFPKKRILELGDERQASTKRLKMDQSLGEGFDVIGSESINR
jgi:hypothetical protein